MPRYTKSPILAQVVSAQVVDSTHSRYVYRFFIKFALYPGCVWFCAVTFGYARDRPPNGLMHTYQLGGISPTNHSDILLCLLLNPPVTILHSILLPVAKQTSFVSTLLSPKNRLGMLLYISQLPNARVKIKNAFHGIYRPTKYTVED